jgi:hypothetical protein
LLEEIFLFFLGFFFLSFWGEGARGIEQKNKRAEREREREKTKERNIKVS